ncbi:hypothetical protein NDU88_011230 [Pleurodeles waltl]|uniref:Uncharacterized protein n=1 Tax=Pleurodeles waltl TaxID=8319 RepID=A0AAV7QWM6_PLEWA|nr:hypothetical protein NDU88_011230 [Pleurodeles waltl]
MRHQRLGDGREGAGGCSGEEIQEAARLRRRGMRPAAPAARHRHAEGAHYEVATIKKYSGNKGDWNVRSCKWQ